MIKPLSIRAVSMIILLLLNLTACNMPDCRNTNPVFDNLTPDTKEYRVELAKQIKNIGAENLSYRHDKYLKKDGDEYIVVNIQSENLCATGEIQVTDWSKISQLRSEVSGYSGAKLEGLDFEIVEDPTGAIFLFKDIDRIVD